MYIYQSNIIDKLQFITCKGFDLLAKKFKYTENVQMS